MKIIKVHKISDVLTTVLLEGEGSWISAHKPKAKFKANGTEYSADLKATAAEVEAFNSELGTSKKLKTSKKDPKDTSINFKASGEYQDGTPTSPIPVFDINRQPMTEDIGNGSLVRLQINIVPYEFAGTVGLSARLTVVQVLNLVPYVKAGLDLDLFDAEDNPNTTNTIPRLF